MWSKWRWVKITSVTSSGATPCDARLSRNAPPEQQRQRALLPDPDVEDGDPVAAADEEPAQRQLQHAVLVEEAAVG